MRLNVSEVDTAPLKSQIRDVPALPLASGFETTSLLDGVAGSRCDDKRLGLSISGAQRKLRPLSFKPSAGSSTPAHRASCWARATEHSRANFTATLLPIQRETDDLEFLRRWPGLTFRADQRHFVALGTTARTLSNKGEPDDHHP